MKSIYLFTFVYFILCELVLPAFLCESNTCTAVTQAPLNMGLFMTSPILDTYILFSGDCIPHVSFFFPLHSWGSSI